MRILHPYEQFWRKVFDYIVENQLPAFDVLYEIIMVPSVVTPSKSLKKELLKHKKIFETTDTRLIAVGVALRSLDYYVATKRFPKIFRYALELLYDAIMKDLRNSQPVSFAEAYEEGGMGNLVADVMRKASRFIIDTILKGQEPENLIKLLEKLREDEEKVQGARAKTTLLEEQIILHVLEGIELPRPLRLDSIVEELDVSEEEILKLLRAQKEEDKLILSAKLLPYIFALLRHYVLFEKAIQEYEERIKRLEQNIEELKDAYRQSLLVAYQEHEELVKQINALKEREKIIRVPTDTSHLEEELAELKAEVQRLQEERDYYADLVEELKEQLRPPEERLTPLPEPITIAYFGLDNPALVHFLNGYNVDVRIYSPIKPPQVVPDLPIVFNIDVASHKVWWAIREKKPLIVTGSNAEILGKRIVSWLKTSVS